MSSNIRVSKTMSDSWPQLDGSNQSQLFTLSFPVDHAADSTFFKRVFFTEKLASQRNFQAKWNILNYFVISDFKKVKRNSDVTRMETKKNQFPLIVQLKFDRTGVSIFDSTTATILSTICIRLPRPNENSIFHSFRYISQICKSHNSFSNKISMRSRAEKQ